jgi:hypothetical protein
MLGWRRRLRSSLDEFAAIGFGSIRWLDGTKYRERSTAAGESDAGKAPAAAAGEQSMQRRQLFTHSQLAQHSTTTPTGHNC